MACLPPAADAPHPLGLLRARGERPSSHRSAEQRNERAAPHSITSSASASNLSSPLVRPSLRQSAPARSGGDITTASHHPRAAGPSRQSRGATSAVGLTPRRRCPREGLARPAERWESRRRLGPGTTALLPRCPSSRGLLGRATNHGGTLAACSPLLGQAVASTGTAGQPPGEPREPQGKQGRGSPPGTQKPEAVVTKTPIP